MNDSTPPTVCQSRREPRAIRYYPEPASKMPQGKACPPQARRPQEPALRDFYAAFA